MNDNGRIKKPRSSQPEVLKIKTEQRSVGRLKTALVLFLIALQAAIIAFFYYVLAQLFQWYLILSLVLALLCSLAIVSSKRRNTSTKAIWVIIVLVCFPFGYIVYFLSDVDVFFAWQKRRYHKIFKAHIPSDGVALPLEGRVKEDCAFFKNCGGFEVFDKSEGEYFPSGGLLFDDVLSRLERAEKFIFLEYFIIADGVLLKRMLSILYEKAAAGVDIRVIYDDMGSGGLFSRKTRKAMRAAGIKVMTFNKLIPVFNIGLNFRDHRKIVVIDGKVAYTGGANLADEYTNEQRMYGYWKDTGVRVEGAAVDGFTRIFLQQWEFLTRKTQDIGQFSGLYDEVEGGGVFVPYSCGLDINAPMAREAYVNVIAKAQERLYIMTPYLVPDDAIMNLLINKAKSGVDVRVILPQIPDKAYVYRISLSNGERLREGGVKVLHMRDSFVHSKVMLADYCAIIGSINLDMRSFYQQFESALYTDNGAILKAVLADFEETFAECEPIKKPRKGIIMKLFDMFLQMVSPLM